MDGLYQVGVPLYFREQKRASAPAGQLEAPSLPEPSRVTEKSDIPRDADSDFSELNPLDDVDVSDQLVYKSPVRHTTQ